MDGALLENENYENDLYLSGSWPQFPYFHIAKNVMGLSDAIQISAYSLINMRQLQILFN